MSVYRYTPWGRMRRPTTLPSGIDMKDEARESAEPSATEERDTLRQQESDLTELLADPPNEGNREHFGEQLATVRKNIARLSRFIEAERRWTRT